MAIVLKDLLGKICLVYIDDILIFDQNEAEHDKNVAKVTERLKS